MKKAWPPGYEPKPHEPKPLHPLRYLRMRQTALENGATGTMLHTFKSPTANVANPEKARLDIPRKQKRGG